MTLLLSAFQIRSVNEIKKLKSAKYLKIRYINLLVSRREALIEKSAKVK